MLLGDTGDLSEERTLLRRQDGLSDSPQAIVHDETRGQLFVSYWGKQQYWLFSVILIRQQGVTSIMSNVRPVCPDHIKNVCS